MSGKRGQAGIEYIMLVSVLLLFLIPIVHYSLTESTTRVKMYQLETSVERIAKAADAVYALGPGAQEVAVVTLPEGIERTIVGNYSVYFVASLFGASSEIGYVTRANVTGSLPMLPGTYRIVMKHMPSGEVNIS